MYQKAGCKINFGLSRGLGSAGFAMMSAITGVSVSKFGTDFLMVSTAVILLFMLCITFFFKKPEGVSEVSDFVEISNRCHIKDIGV